MGLLLADEYQELSQRTAGRAELHLDADSAAILASGLGIAGEGGEFADHIKKWAFHGHELNVDYLAKELGDILWYVALAATALKLSLSRIMQENVDKLKKRYPDGFSSEASINRVV